MIEVIRPGQFTSIQDLGRFGYRSMGVPVSGAMDQDSANLANHLLGNEPNAALIEMTFVGATFLFQKPATIAFTGARCDIKLNGILVEDQSILRLEAGSTLAFGAIRDGNFLYLAIMGGFKAEMTLGSACYFEAINGMVRMTKGMSLSFDESLQEKPIDLGIKRKVLAKPNTYIEVEKGPEFHLLSKEDIQLLMETDFSISSYSNRMGFQLNEHFHIQINEIISSPVQAGTVQLTKGGQLIVLMRDAQTVGGYSRILQLTPKSINQLAQTDRRDHIRFRLMD